MNISSPRVRGFEEKLMIYLDSHATTRTDPRVVSAMLPYFTELYANPASVHSLGVEAAGAIDLARERVAKLINADPDHIYFTSGATESNNIIFSTYFPAIYTTNTEHKSIIQALKTSPSTNKHKFKVDTEGFLNYNNIQGRKIPAKSLISVIAANNEIGTIHDLETLGNICAEKDCYFHTDATQALGKISIDVKKMNIWALTLSAHKIYGPKGIGALYCRDVSLLEPILKGGQQDVISSGTQNVPGIVGLGKACALLQGSQQHQENERIRHLRNILLHKLQQGISDLILNGTISRIQNNLNVSIPGVPSEVFTKGLPNIALSSGSACSAGYDEPSHVLKAIRAKYPECAVRFGLSKWTTQEEIDYVAAKIIKITKELRGT